MEEQKNGVSEGMKIYRKQVKIGTVKYNGKIVKCCPQVAYREAGQTIQNSSDHLGR